MTDHLETERILVLRDGVEAATPEERDHVAACAACAAALAEARLRRQRVERGLERLDPPGDMDVRTTRAREAVRRALSATPSLPSPASVPDSPAPSVAPHRRWLPHLGRAAAVLILAAGAAWALPGSPLRSWWAAREAASPSSAAAEAGGEQAAPAAAAAPDVTAPPTTGVRIPAPPGVVTISLAGLPPGGRVEVRWVDTPDVEVRAGPGSRFTTADDRIEVLVQGDAARVVLPAAGGGSVLRVSGHVYLRGTAAAPVFPGPAPERRGTSLVFTVPPRGGP